MVDINGWQLALLVLAAYFSTVTLVRMMQNRRDQVVSDLQRQVALVLRQRKTKRKKKRGSRHSSSTSTNKAA